MEIGALECFTMLFGVTEAIGALLLVLVTVWLASYRGGFAWQVNPKIQFNWHPLLMTLGMIFMYGNAILIYRAFRNSRKRKLKISHAVVNGVAFILTVIGLKAVFDSHNLASPPIPNMYSLHSWLGLGAVILFCCQWVAGLIVFLYPTLNPPLRATYYPVHIFFGISAFVCAAAASLLGLTEKAIFAVSDYSNFASEGLLINVIGIVVIVFATLVIHLVSEPKYKRQPLPEDEMLLTSTEKVKKIPKENSLICYEAGETPAIVPQSHHHHQHEYVDVNHHHHHHHHDQINPADLKSCELVLECFGDEEETLKIKIDHMHESGRACWEDA